MDYVNRYFSGWHSKTSKGYLYIDQYGYSGGAEELKLSYDGLFVSKSFINWNNPIIGSQLEFSIVNDKTNFYALLPLLSAEEREFKIRVVKLLSTGGDFDEEFFDPNDFDTSETLFEGFLNCDTVSQKYLHRQKINFIASGYINKLDNFHPLSIDTLQNTNFISILNEILISAGQSFDIRVNCKLIAEGDIHTAGQTLFNKNGFYTELFWENETDRKSSFAVLKSILTSFDCYIYWHQSKWYIERYEDIWETNKSYVEYLSTITYGTEDAGSVVNVVETIKNLHEFKFTEQSQTLSINPGLKTIRINLNDSRLLNLTRNQLANPNVLYSTVVWPYTDTIIPEPAFRSWDVWSTPKISWSEKGLPKGIISNAIKRTIDYSTLPTPIMPRWYSGLFTKFKVTVDAADVALQIKFKYVVDPTTITVIIDENNPVFTKVWKDYDFIFHWYLRNLPGTNYIASSGDSWKKLSSADPEKYMQTTTINGGSFDSTNNSVEVSLSVPLGLVDIYTQDLYEGKMTGDQTFVLCIGLETIVAAGVGDVHGPTAKEAWLGDIFITSTGGLQDNVIEGSINNKFLNKKEIPLDLYDVPNYNYRNSIFRGSDLSIRTERWGILGGSAVVLEKGIVWATHSDPTIADNILINGAGFASFNSIMYGLLSNTDYYVRAYAIDGNGIKYGENVLFHTTQIAVGDYYRGGVIAYIFQPGDPGHVVGEDHGIIAALADQGRQVYGRLSGGGPYVSQAYESQLGYAGGNLGGKYNTDKLMANTFVNQFAVKLCNDYENLGYLDWQFPSFDELSKLRLNRHKIGGFKNDWYWSSTEREDGGGFLGLSWWKYAKAINFGSDTKSDSIHKHETFNVRAIRYF